jgi:hypothetical protein
MSMTQAGGPGNSSMFGGLDPTITSGASIKTVVTGDRDRMALAHGLLMVLSALVLAPVDLILAALRRWPITQLVVVALYGITVLTGFGVGIAVSAEYLAVGCPQPNLNADLPC